MKTFRVLLGLASLLTVLAISASPAAANFEATQAGTTQGPYQLKSGVNAVFSNGSIPVECTSVTNGAWHIQNKASKVVTSPETKVTQELTKNGPHQELTGQFTGCTAKVIFTFPAEVNSTCALQVEQTGTSTFTGTTTSKCIVTVPSANCTVTITAGNPNAGLTEVKSVNITGGKEDISNVSGITSTSGSGCPSPETNKVGTFKATGIAHSQKIV